MMHWRLLILFCSFLGQCRFIQLALAEWHSTPAYVGAVPLPQSSIRLLPCTLSQHIKRRIIGAGATVPEGAAGSGVMGRPARNQEPECRRPAATMLAGESKLTSQRIAPLTYAADSWKCSRSRKMTGMP